MTPYEFFTQYFDENDKPLTFLEAYELYKSKIQRRPDLNQFLQSLWAINFLDVDRENRIIRRKS